MSPFLLLAALFPAAALLVRVYRLDKIEKEPPRVLWTLIGCGALAALAAYALQCVLLRLLDGWLPAGGLGNLIVRNFLIVACSEELCKRLPVRTVLWHHPAFDYRFDAVVYCVFSAVYMGIYLGEAKVCERCGQRRRRGYYLLCSLAVPVLLHGFWDFDLSIPSPWATVVFYVFVLAFFLRANRLLLHASENDVRLDRQMWERN